MLPLNYNFLMGHKVHNIVDCFPYFNEKELLELRINLLKDYVDKFVIVDANYTHSGNKKEYTLKKTISELKLPSEKIEVIEVDLSEECLPDCDFYDEHFLNTSQKTSRERFQRDVISKCLDTNNFSEETIFIISDCDEIINPKYIDTYKKACYDNPQFIFKADLVYLEGKCNCRLYCSDSPDIPAEWRYSLFFCNKNQLKNMSLSAIRGGVYDYLIRWVYSGDDRIKDVGWHFSWMGSNQNRILKSKSFCHYNQEIDTLKYSNYSNVEMENFLLEYNFSEGEICPSGNIGMIIKQYPLENLPQIIFDLPRVKQFLLPQLAYNGTN